MWTSFVGLQFFISLTDKDLEMWSPSVVSLLLLLWTVEADQATDQKVFYHGVQKFWDKYNDAIDTILALR